jgi:hypothetical protein
MMDDEHPFSVLKEMEDANSISNIIVAEQWIPDTRKWSIQISAVCPVSGSVSSKGTAPRKQDGKRMAAAELLSILRNGRVITLWSAIHLANHLSSRYQVPIVTRGFASVLREK